LLHIVLTEPVFSALDELVDDARDRGRLCEHLCESGARKRIFGSELGVSLGLPIIHLRLNIRDLICEVVDAAYSVSVRDPLADNRVGCAVADEDLGWKVVV
jgi:hypothetical protein